MKKEIGAFLNEYKQMHLININSLNDVNQKNYKQYTNRNIPDYIAWGLNTNSDMLEYIGVENNFFAAKNISLDAFMSLIHPAFISYYRDVFLGLLITSDNSCEKTENFYLRMTIPIQADAHTDKYMTVKLTIVPLISEKIIYNVVFIVNFIKRYTNDCFEINVINQNGKQDNGLTENFKNYISPAELYLTEEQKRTAELIFKGYTSDMISVLLSKSIHSTYKINRRIIDKISEFYDFKFKNVNEAVEFHYKCFT